MKEGERISHSEYVAANKAKVAQDLVQTKADAKPPKAPYSGQDRMAIMAAGGNPDDETTLTPTVLKKAFDIKKERPPVTNNYINTPEAKNALANAPTDGSRNEAFLKTMSPQDQAYVKGLADYDLEPPKGFALKDPGVRSLLSNAKLYDPAYDEKEYPSRSAIKKDYQSAKRGTTGGNLVSLNTLTGHLGTLHDMAVAMQNKDIPTYNRLANLLSKETGDPRVTNFNLAKNAVATELSTALKGQATEGDIKSWRDAINGSGSAKQLYGNIAVPLHLMQTRFGELQTKYQDTMGKPFKVLSPAAAETLRKFNLDPGTVDPRFANTPGGGQQLQYLHSDGKGNTIGWNGSAWVPTTQH